MRSMSQESRGLDLRTQRFSEKKRVVSRIRRRKFLNPENMSRQEDEHVSELSRGATSVRVKPTFDPLFLEVGVPLIPYQEPRGLPAKEILASKAQSPKPFDAHTLRSRLSSYDLKILRDKYEIPSSVKLRLPGDGEVANMTTLNEIGVYYDTFVNGFRVPIHPFFIRVLNAYSLAPDQLSPHAWTCNMLKEKNLNETNLDHIEKLKAAEPLESKYPLSNDQLRTHGSAGGSCVDSPLFNTRGVLGEIIPDELASVHGVDEGIQDLDFDVLTAEPQPKKPMTDEIVLGLTSKDKGKDQSKRKRVPLRAGTSSSARSDTPHRPDWNLSIEESVFKSPRTAWEWSSNGIIPMDRVMLSGYDISHTANGMVQLTSQALAQVHIGAEKLIAAEKVLDEERKLVQVENNFRREAEKKVEDLTRALQKVKFSKASIAARVERLEAEKTKIGLNAVQSFKRSKVYTDQRLHESKRVLVYGYNNCKKDILKDYSDMNLSIYEHKYVREVAADESNRREEAEARVISQATANPTSSTSRSLGMSGAASAVVTVPQHMEIEAGLPRDIEMDASHEAAE
ncbi:hypothetical protein RJ639_022749 [Escallonia herrerae]|uniref:Transposase (putative) gypsy type domain-containing protein n=1 Tax=Escallonia herrerae TaxID=1293975 RepID=A0AA89AEG0_9ASTE|nr:hypothetical protein RJ639_022749 [Escallonia herrerae]